MNLEEKYVGKWILNTNPSKGFLYDFPLSIAKVDGVLTPNFLIIRGKDRPNRRRAIFNPLVNVKDVILLDCLDTKKARI